MKRSPKGRTTARRSGVSTALLKARSDLDAAAKEVSRLAETKAAESTVPLDIALSSPEVIDRLASKIVVAGAQPDVYYIPTSTLSTWVVFRFKPMLPPLTFRVNVDVGARKVVAIEDPYIPDRLY
jgi:hypothetical protein